MSVRFTLLAAALLATPLASAKEPRADRIALALPVVVEAATPGPATTIGAGEFFGAQRARYRSTATIDRAFALPNGFELFPAGARLIEHAATGKALTGPVYCRPARVAKMVNLFCFDDGDADGRFDRMWVGGALFGSADVLDIYLPQADAVDARLPPSALGYRLVPSGEADAVALGFKISGSNPLLGQHHFYAAFGTTQTSVTMIETHKAARLSAVPSSFKIAEATIEAARLPDKRYSVRVATPLPAGERMLVAPYPTRTMWIYVPG